MFFSAVSSGNVPALKKLLGSGPRSAAVYMPNGKSLLHRVIECKHSTAISRNMVLLLLAHGVQIESRLVENNYTPLMLAIALQRLDMVEVLMERKANPNTLIGVDPMGFEMIAKLRDAPYFDQVLRATGMDVNARNSTGETMLEVSLRRDRFQMVLLQYQVDVDARFNMPLMERVARTKQASEVLNAVLMRSASPYRLYMSPFMDGTCLRDYSALTDELYGACLQWERRFFYWMVLTPRTLVWKKAPGCRIDTLPRELIKALVNFLLPESYE